MKKYLMTGIAALTLCAGFTSCSHDFEPMTQAEIDKAKYDQAFLKYVGGKIAADQDWGFGTTTALTRAADTWTDNHSCNWIDKLNVVLPEGATEMTSPGWLSTGVYVVPTNGSVSLGWANFNEGDKIYILGNVTELKEANYNGTVTFYNVGTLTYSISSGNRHTIINTGTLTINNYANVGEVYNSGTLNLVKEYNPYWNNPNATADIPDAMSVFSTGEGSVLMPDGGDFKAAADIHGTLVADADTKIQNSKTQYICGVKVDGVLDMTEGHLQSSSIEADEIKFDGSYIWLLPGGHIKADVIRMPNSATAIYGESTSTGLIEVGDIYFQNTNNFDDSFSGNIYFQISGAIDFSNSTKFGGGAKHYNDVAAYNADNTPLKGYNESDVATGSPKCGTPWTVGTPKKDEFTFLCRVFAEDLSASESTDFDFNDVVFDVYTNKENKAKVVILAAGGTLPLYVAGQEVHGLFGEGYATDIMINTNARGGVDGVASVELPFLIEGVSGLTDVNTKIVVKVMKSGEEQTLTAERGKPAAKFAVTEQVQWVDERVDISEIYRSFKDWASTGTPAEWWK